MQIKVEDIVTKAQKGPVFSPQGACGRTISRIGGSHQFYLLPQVT